MSSMEKKRQQIKYFTKKKKQVMEPWRSWMLRNYIYLTWSSNLKQTSVLILIIPRDTETTGKESKLCSPDGPSDCLYRLIFFTDSFAFLVILNILFKLTCVSNRIKEVQITQMDGDQNQNLIIIVNVSRSRGKRMAPWTWNNHLSEKDPSQYLERCDLVGNRVINSFIFITSKISNHFYFSKNCI